MSPLEPFLNIGVTFASFQSAATLPSANDWVKIWARARAVLGQISRAFHYRDRHIFVKLYKQYVRPHIEFSTQAWSPWTEADKAVLEKVQRKAVGMISGLRENDYEGKLRELQLETLSERRHQADMQMMYKIVHGIGGLELSTWFVAAGDCARATCATADHLNVKVKTGRLEVRRNFFSVRAAGQWNEVPNHIKRAKNVGKFKSDLKLYRANLMQVA